MEKKGLKKLEQGKKTLVRKFGLGNKHKSALKSFKEAAEILKDCHNTLDYAEAEKMAGECYDNLKQPHSAAGCFKRAGEALLSTRSKSVARMLGEYRGRGNENIDAFKCLTRAAECYSEFGKMFSAGKVERDVAEFIVEECGDIKKSLEFQKERKEMQEREVKNGEEEKKEKKEEEEKTESLEDGEKTDDEDSDEDEKKEEVLKIEEKKDDEKEKQKKENEESEVKKVTDEDIKKIKESLKKKVDLMISHYDKAIHYFDLGNNHGIINTTIVSAGDYCTEFGNYEKGIYYYDKILNAKWNEQSDNVGTKDKLMHTKDKIITKALIAHLLNIKHESFAEDLEDVSVAVKDYLENSRTFKTSDQYKLINGICMAFENHSLKMFKKAVKRYSKTNKIKDDFLDNLVVVKEKLNELIKKQDEDDEDIN